jgi:hypothetical protein
MKLSDAFQERAKRRHRRVRAAAIMIFAVLIGIMVVAGMSEIYAKCGPLCRQGLLQAQRDRY